jgi:hypothetical protein
MRHAGSNRDEVLALFRLGRFKYDAVDSSERRCGRDFGSRAAPGIAPSSLKRLSIIGDQWVRCGLSQ